MVSYGFLMVTYGFLMVSDGFWGGWRRLGEGWEKAGRRLGGCWEADFGRTKISPKQDQELDSAILGDIFGFSVFCSVVWS